jgi:hypothetical protein
MPHARETHLYITLDAGCVGTLNCNGWSSLRKDALSFEADSMKEEEKEMVGTRRLELLTSTVSIDRWLVTDRNLTARMALEIGFRALRKA